MFVEPSEFLILRLATPLELIVPVTVPPLLPDAVAASAPVELIVKLVIGVIFPPEPELKSIADPV